MTRTLRWIAILMLATQPALSAPASDAELHRLAKAIGIYDQIAEQKVALERQAEGSARQYAARIMSALPGLDPELQEEMGRELKVYITGLGGLIDADHMIQAYINLIRPRLSAEEVEEITAFYESDIGRRFTQVNTEVSGPWVEAFMSDFNQKLAEHLDAYMASLNQIAARHNKQPKPTP